jgi:hypothetical protein
MINSDVVHPSRWACGKPFRPEGFLCPKFTNRAARSHDASFPCERRPIVRQRHLPLRPDTHSRPPCSNREAGTP